MRPAEFLLVKNFGPPGSLCQGALFLKFLTYGASKPPISVWFPRHLFMHDEV